MKTIIFAFKLLIKLSDYYRNSAPFFFFFFENPNFFESQNTRRDRAAKEGRTWKELVNGS